MKLLKIGDKLATVGGKPLESVDLPAPTLLLDLCPVGEDVKNRVTGEKIRGLIVNADGTFSLEKKSVLNVLSNVELKSYTIAVIADRSSSSSGYNDYFCVNKSTSYPIRVSSKWGPSGNVPWNDMNSDLFTRTWFGQYESRYAYLSPVLLTPEEDEFIAISRNTDTKTVVFCQNEGQTTYTYADTDKIKDITSVQVISKRKYREIIVYDGALFADELMRLYLKKHGKNPVVYHPSDYAQGLEGLDCPNGYCARSSEIPKWDMESIDYTVIKRSSPTVNEDMTSYTNLYFVNPVDKLDVGEKYNLEAHPFPYNLTKTSYNVEYSSSDESVIACYQGFLIAKGEGSATITAKISNTEIIATQTIKVTKPVEKIKHYYHLNANYTNGANALSSTDSEAVLKAMVSAIYEASEKGYNGILFPRLTYHIKPYQHGEAHCHVPTNFTIDFNGSVIYIDDNTYCHQENGRSGKDGYNLFEFGDGDWNNYYGTPCLDSTICNATVYGERYGNTTRAEDHYTEFVTFVSFGCRCERCTISNIHFEGTVGFNIATDTNGYKIWSGTGQNGCRRGCTLETDYTAGRLAEDGTAVNDETGWYYTKNYIKIGYFYGKKDFTGIIKYRVGQMQYISAGISGRWYDIFFYDENYNMISHGMHQFCLEPYDFPKKAVYMKMSILSNDAPKNAISDVPAALRLFPWCEPDKWKIKDCTFINPHSSAVSITGGARGIIENCYAQQGKRYGWSIDFEDGWMGMRHNMMYRVLCDGLVTFPGGHNTAVVSCCLYSMSARGDTENLRFVNDWFLNFTHRVKTNDVVECCTQCNDEASTGQYTGVSTSREINLTKTTFTY